MMERSDVERLLRLRYSFTDQRFSDQTVDDWHLVLVDVAYHAARTVMIQLERDGHHKIDLADLAAARPKRTHSERVVRAGPRCEACGGDGWVPSRRDRGVWRYLPCAQCQPDHPMLRRQLTETLDEEYARLYGAPTLKEF